METPFRVGQRVLCVEWRKGQPFLKFGTVTKVTSRTYYVDGAKQCGWYSTAQQAINAEYLSLFREWDVLFGNRSSGWTVNATVRCVCRMRRLERRIQQQPPATTKEEKG